ncbi:protein STRUBBELIG-RECEPTOR FAMILY 7 [Sesamum angolense]|uniref:Protein STRUBBELIG-RECEPTOR FAMILY 7 n=1 Tax=Sesamum angolense TaxID=2727404 RepID=A0AAE1WQR1_9LAMI|nr:protein STRUBBELIG-RECEPTOR FAMILY 7 [Sesamum angolense]
MEFHPLLLLETFHGAFMPANLYSLFRDFSFNSLTDNLPQSFQSLKNINDINLAGNGFNGGHPYSISLMTSLRYLFTGTLDVLANLPLQNLNLAGNGFNGGLPYSISLMTSLSYLNVTHNQIQGQVNVQFNSLTSLSTLDFSFYSLTDNLPQSFQSLTNINDIFTGTLDVLANLPLQNLNIENNHFTGWIPEQLKGINLNNLAGNSFNGGLPYSISLMTSLRYLNVTHNQIQGQVNVQFNSLTPLSTLDFSFNSLTDNLPQIFQSLTNINVYWNP